MIKSINVNGIVLEYDLQRKKVKNINLRVRPDGSVTVSANNRVSEERIEEFVRKNAETVIRAVKKYRDAAKNSPSSLEYVDGEKVRVLGEDLTLRIMTGKRSKAEQNGNDITIIVPDPSNREEKARALDTFMRDVCKTATLEAFKRIYPRIEALGVAEPTVKFRKMTRKWGICRPERRELTFAYMLAAVPMDSIEYVVLHELVHLIHPDHSRRFYSKLAELMPDWQIRKKKLEGNALQ